MPITPPTAMPPSASFSKAQAAVLVKKKRWSATPPRRRRCLTFSQLKQNVQALSEAFRLSLPEGNIAILSENSIEWLLVYFALIVSGRTAVCIDIEQSDDVLRSMILQADCTACFLSPAFEPVGSLLCQENPRLKQLLLMEKEGKGALAELLAQGQAITARHQGGWSFPDHAETFTASIVYTSGTTSTSKPVMLSEVGTLQCRRLDAVGCRGGNGVYLAALLPHLRPDLFRHQHASARQHGRRQRLVKNDDARFKNLRAGNDDGRAR